MGSKVFAFGDIAGPVQFGKPAVLKKATHPELTERAAFVLASRPCRAYRVIRRSRSRVMPAASMAIARTVTSDMSIPVWASESAADVLPPATTPVFAPGLAEDEPPDVPPGTVPGLFCSLPPGAVLFGLGCVTIALRAVHQKGRQPLRAWSLYASFSLPVSLIAVRPADAAEIHVRSRQRGCLHYARGSRLSYRPGQYVAERIIVAFISALSLTVIAIADFSNRMVEKNLVAIAAYVLLPALAATAWLRTCHQWPAARPATCAGYSVPPRATRQASNRCNRSENASHSCASAPLPGESPISTISRGIDVFLRPITVPYPKAATARTARLVRIRQQARPREAFAAGTQPRPRRPAARWRPVTRRANRRRASPHPLKPRTCAR